jgi:hypothetical protein
MDALIALASPASRCVVEAFSYCQTKLKFLGYSADGEFLVMLGEYSIVDGSHLVPTFVPTVRSTGC